jgi:hypothetical protein
LSKMVNSEKEQFVSGDSIVYNLEKESMHEQDSKIDCVNEYLNRHTKRVEFYLENQK